MVQAFPEEALVAAVDGLGRGEEAAAATCLTASVREGYSFGRSLAVLLGDCHEKLRGSHGTVISLASLTASDDSSTWLGVGNVEGLLLRKPSRGDAPDLKAQEALSLHEVSWDTSCFVCRPPPFRLVPRPDGVCDGWHTTGFADYIHRGDSARRIAQRILNRHASETDDALVLVVRYLHEQNWTHYR